MGPAILPKVKWGRLRTLLLDLPAAIYSACHH
jgi:hypothetical protein